jgi:hypothetical protein
MSCPLDVNTGLRYADTMTTRKDMEDLQREAIAQGWRIVKGRKHVKWIPPDPGKPIVVSAATPSDHRAVKNTRSLLRRSGLRRE